MSRQFSSPVDDRFSDIEWRLGRLGVPILFADSLSWLECRVSKTVESGDHVILIGDVEAGAAPPPQSRPLMYFRHRYEEWAGSVDDDTDQVQPPVEVRLSRPADVRRPSVA